MSTAVDDLLDAMSKDVPQVLIQAVSEATDLRAQIESPPLESDFDGIHEAMVHNRQILDRLEYLTSTLVLLRSRAAKAQAKTKGAVDDAMSKAATAPSVGFGDYTSAEEKKGNFHAAALPQILEHRKAEAMYRDVDSAWDYCRILLRGAEGSHRDLELRMRLLNVRSALM